MRTEKWEGVADEHDCWAPRFINHNKQKARLYAFMII